MPDTSSIDTNTGAMEMQITPTTVAAASASLAGIPGQVPAQAWTINDPAAPWSGAWDVFDCVDMPEALANALLDELGLDDDTCCDVNVFLLADMKVTNYTEYGGSSITEIYGLYVISGHDQDPKGLYTQAKINSDLMARLEAYVRAEALK